MFPFLADDDVNRVLQKPLYDSWILQYLHADPNNLDNIGTASTHDPRDLLGQLENYKNELSSRIKRLPFYYSFLLTVGKSVNWFEAIWNDEEWRFSGHSNSCSARCKSHEEEIDFTKSDTLPTISCYVAEHENDIDAGFSKAYLRYWNKEPLDEVIIKRENFLEHFSGLYEDLSAFFKMASEGGYRVCFYAMRV